MTLTLLRRLSNTLRELDNILSNIFRQAFDPEHCHGALVSLPLAGHGTGSYHLHDVWENSILWAVPKKRRTIEKRMQRKFGHPKYVYKLILPKNNLIVCTSCGHFREAGVLCPHCYDKIQQETEAMKTKIETELGLSPIEQEVIVLYEGEANVEPTEFWKGKRIVEMDKPRPSWFSKNLLQRTTTSTSDSTDVKPSDLA